MSIASPHSRAPSDTTARPIAARVGKSRRVALVLSGGGARGAYEAGVIKGLEELGIRVDIVVGTSAGALNALLYALSDAHQLEELWKSIRKSDVFQTRWWLFLVKVIATCLCLLILYYFLRTLPGAAAYLGPQEAISHRDISFLSYTLVVAVFMPAVAQWGIHITGRRFGKFSDWLDRNVAFANSFYTTTALTMTMWREVRRITSQLSNESSPHRWTLSSCRLVNSCISLIRLCFFGTFLAMLLLGGLHFILVGIAVLIAYFAIGVYTTILLSKRLAGVSQRCVSRLLRGLDEGKGSAREIIITACDLDARCDSTFFLLKKPYEADYCLRQARRAELLFGITIPEHFRNFGGYDYINLRYSKQSLLSSVIASASIPLVFPPQRITLPPSGLWHGSTHRYVDGGVGNNTPIKAAEDCCATHIIVVEVHPRTVDFVTEPLCTFLDVGIRTVGAMLTASIDQEYHRFTDMSYLKQAVNESRAKLFVIRPSQEIRIHTLAFGKEVRELIAQGRADALHSKQLQSILSVEEAGALPGAP